ncbi:LAME_0B05402g1_1 [Lachancea meyersii CBS 8951]|uniref:LAME_0B05402g1_1 n=1 Tax=Lachancea meyersii CBS 8951 TaxID=1266667 RepID=A0A1G4IVR0_9SACH|nr:LAME_0B05402g1_1 [Lachancea meyersii CBS 8951]
MFTSFGKANLTCQLYHSLNVLFDLRQMNAPSLSNVGSLEFLKVFEAACSGMLPKNKIIRTLKRLYTNTTAEIEQKSRQGRDTLDLKREVIALSTALASVADTIPAYDLEKHNTRLMKLLKQITIDAPSTTKKFRFKNKPKSSQSKNDDAVQNVAGEDSKSMNSPECVGKSLRYERGGVYENLQDSSLTFDATLQNDPASDNSSSAIHLRSLKRSVINFKGTPFQHGSFYIENAQDCFIILRLPLQSQIQVRLNGLQNCKIYITRVGLEPQSVVLERCSELRFHSEMRDTTNIQDFSSIGKVFPNEKTWFPYESFDLCDFDTDRLMNDKACR